MEIQQQLTHLQGLGIGRAARRQPPPPRKPKLTREQKRRLAGQGESRKKKGKEERRKRGSKLEFKRVDYLWDSTIHNYKLTDTAKDEESSEYDQYLFNVKRTFDWEGKYKVRALFFCGNA